jgi:hypothetical protein
MIKRIDIEQAQEKIHHLILTQAQIGAQTAVVKKIDQDLVALGQFLSDKDRNQRGIHGSAAGLRVLATYDSNKETVSGLVKYLENREAIESGITADDERINADSIKRDENNVIKLSEILYAVHFVKPAQVSKDAYAASLGQKLQTAIITDPVNNFKGWDWYLDDNRNIHLLPSAFAMLALEKNGFFDQMVHDTIFNKIEKETLNDPASLAISVYCLYVLIKTSKNLEEEGKKYKIILKKIWRSRHCSLQNDYEQNLEYWFNSQHEYARIPWQILIIAITCKMSKWKFYTVNVQRRLISLIAQAKAPGVI